MGPSDRRVEQTNHLTDDWDTRLDPGFLNFLVSEIDIRYGSCPSGPCLVSLLDRHSVFESPLSLDENCLSFFIHTYIHL